MATSSRSSARPRSGTRRPAARKRSRRGARSRWRLPALEQHQLDLIGLGAIAAGVFLGFVLYRGGVIGEGLYWGADHLVSTVGAHVLVVFLFLAGLLLVTGASLAAILTGAGRHVAESTRAVRRTLPARPLPVPARPARPPARPA